MIYACSIERITRGYLAMNQLSKLCASSSAHVYATVSTELGANEREFSWLWVEAEKRPVLVNRLTGTLFEPETGQGINCAPRIIDAPITAPRMNLSPGMCLPAGTFSTQQ